MLLSFAVTDKLEESRECKVFVPEVCALKELDRSFILQLRAKGKGRRKFSNSEVEKIKSGLTEFFQQCTIKHFVFSKIHKASFSVLTLMKILFELNSFIHLQSIAMRDETFSPNVRFYLRSLRYLYQINSQEIDINLQRHPQGEQVKHIFHFIPCLNEDQSLEIYSYLFTVSKKGSYVNCKFRAKFKRSLDFARILRKIETSNIHNHRFNITLENPVFYFQKLRKVPDAVRWMKVMSSGSVLNENAVGAFLLLHERNVLLDLTDQTFFLLKLGLTKDIRGGTFASKLDKYYIKEIEVQKHLRIRRAYGSSDIAGIAQKLEFLRYAKHIFSHE